MSGGINLVLGGMLFARGRRGRHDRQRALWPARAARRRSSAATGSWRVAEALDAAIRSPRSPSLIGPRTSSSRSRTCSGERARAAAAGDLRCRARRRRSSCSTARRARARSTSTWRRSASMRMPGPGRTGSAGRTASASWWSRRASRISFEVAAPSYYTRDFRSERPAALAGRAPRRRRVADDLRRSPAGRRGGSSAASSSAGGGAAADGASGALRRARRRGARPDDPGRQRGRCAARLVHGRGYVAEDVVKALGQSVPRAPAPVQTRVRVSLCDWLSDSDPSALATALARSRRRGDSTLAANDDDCARRRPDERARRHRDAGPSCRSARAHGEGGRPARLEELGAQIILGKIYHLDFRPGHGAHRGARRPAPLHGLAADPRPTRRLPGVLARQTRKIAADGVTFRSSTTAPRRASRPRSRWPSRRRSALTSPWRSTSARRGRVARRPRACCRAHARWAERCVAVLRPRVSALRDRAGWDRRRAVRTLRR